MTILTKRIVGYIISTTLLKKGGTYEANTDTIASKSLQLELSAANSVQINNQERRIMVQSDKNKELKKIFEVDYSKYEHIKIEKKGRVAVVTLNRPPHNFLNVKMHKELCDIPRDLRQDEDVRAIVLRAEGRNFCAGGDYELFEFNKDDPIAAHQHFEEARDTVWNWIELEKPAIVAVQGLATGMGCQVALICDMVFAADDETTRFSDGHMNIGVAPGDGGVLIWPLLIGLARAKQYLYTADPVYAREAERIGLINRVVPPDQLLPTAMEWATRFANGPTLAIRWAKASLNQYLRMFAVNCYHYSWAFQAASRGSPDVAEAHAALREKRPPKFY